MKKIKANFLIFLSAAWILFAFLYFKIPATTNTLEQDIKFEAKIVEYPEARLDEFVLVVKNKSIPSKIRITTKNLADYSYGDILQINGAIEEPKNFSDFDWRAYLAKQGIYYVINGADVEILKSDKFSIQKYLGRLKNNLSWGLDKALLPPHSSLYKAMLLREKSGIDDTQREQVQKAGLSHILAISGLHIAVITLLLFYVLLTFGMWRRHASYLTLGILILYIMMIGAPASAVRAGIMASVIILAETFGRPNASWRALFYAAALMLVFKPLLIRYDIGFQLSFLAVLGIILFYEYLNKGLLKLQKFIVGFFTRTSVTKDMPVATYFSEVRFGFTSILAVTLSAQALTFPLVIYHFGVFSLWSPVTNLLIIPVLPLALIFGFIAATFGALNFMPAILATPAWLFSSYIWSVVSFFGT